MAFDEKKEKEKLQGIFEKLPENMKLLTEGLVCNASFMICELEKLQNQISGSGEVEQYLHGKGQSGNIMSAATKSYLQMQKNYVQTINALAKLIPAIDEEEHKNFWDEELQNQRDAKKDALKEFVDQQEEDTNDSEMMERIKNKFAEKRKDTI